MKRVYGIIESPYVNTDLAKKKNKQTNKQTINLLKPTRGRISSVGRAPDCRVGGRGFDSRGRTNTQSLKITEK